MWMPCVPHLHFATLADAHASKTHSLPAMPQLPGGWAAQRYGGSHMLTTSFLLWSLASILTPGSAKNTRAIIIARVLVGIAQGFLIPAIHTGQ